jgi:hypothetical protein
LLDPARQLRFWRRPRECDEYPAPGEIILYPGGVSETEILIAYGAVRFASKVGQLAGNHFLTIVDGLEHLRPLGELTLSHGAQTIEFHRCAQP